MDALLYLEKHICIPIFHFTLHSLLLVLTFNECEIDTNVVFLRDHFCGTKILNCKWVILVTLGDFHHLHGFGEHRLVIVRGLQLFWL